MLRLGSRQRRYRTILDLLRIDSSAEFILDLGGGPASFFAAMYPMPERVILIDIEYRLALQARKNRLATHVVMADGDRLPLADGSIGVTICNSVIEHVDDPRSLAAEIRRVSQSYFVQTPCERFPLETHSYIAIPLYNLIPWPCLRRSVCALFGADFNYVDSVRYLSEEMLVRLFPEATVTGETVLGLDKSFYAHFRDEGPKPTWSTVG